MALDAAEKLQQDGISCRVIDCFTIKPIDKDILEKAARETGGIVTCEEHNIMGGFGSAVSEVVSESYPVPIRRIGAQDKCLVNLLVIMKFHNYWKNMESHQLI